MILQFIKKNVFFIIFIIIIFFLKYKKKYTRENYNGDKVKFYNFNTSWCYYSKILQPEWDKLSNYYKNNTKVKILDIKCDNKKNKSICKKFNIRKFPTLIKIKSGKQTYYNGKRTLNKFIEFIEK